MFTVHFSPGVFMSFGTAIAKTATERKASEFVRAFAPNEMGVIFSDWFERDGCYVSEVYDWASCWSAAPPVMAVIVAPLGFKPSQKSPC